jgi:hypothetical protein
MGSSRQAVNIYAHSLVLPNIHLFCLKQAQLTHCNQAHHRALVVSVSGEAALRTRSFCRRAQRVSNRHSPCILQCLSSYSSCKENKKIKEKLSLRCVYACLSWLGEDASKLWSGCLISEIRTGTRRLGSECSLSTHPVVSSRRPSP